MRCRRRDASRSPCCCSTSTASRMSTTRSAIRPATRSIREFGDAAALADARDRHLARLGGDEFAILSRAMRAGRRPSASRERIIDASASRSDHRRPQVYVGVSIGIACRQRTARDRLELMRKADIALYRAKAAGRDTLSPVQPRHGRRASSCRGQIEDELRSALCERRGLCLHYQPQVGSRRRGSSASKPCPLGPSDARPDPARPVHPDRRGIRPDRAARANGCCASLPAVAPLAGRCSSR